MSNILLIIGSVNKIIVRNLARLRGALTESTLHHLQKKEAPNHIRRVSISLKHTDQSGPMTSSADHNSEAAGSRFLTVKT